MKTTILMCMRNLIREKFSEEKWQAIVENTGVSSETILVPYDDIEDSIMVKIIENSCRLLKMTRKEIADAFGEYWMNSYAPKIYQVYFMGNKSAKELIMNLSKIHDMVTRKMPNAHPPKFEYEWISEKILQIKYLSNRNLLDFFIGLLKGVGNFYKEKLIISQLSGNKVQVTFN